MIPDWEITAFDSRREDEFGCRSRTDKGCMVSIQVGGEDKTAEITNWWIWSDKNEGLQLKCVYSKKGMVTHPLSDCRIAPVRELGAMLLTKPGSVIVTPVVKATIYGERYAVVFRPGFDQPQIHKMDGISLAAPTAMKETPVFRYFEVVANARMSRAGSDSDREINANVARQLAFRPVEALFQVGHWPCLDPGS